MPALRDPRLELFARECVIGLARGLKKGEAAIEAAKVAGYPKPQSRSFAPNARKRMQRKDVQARMTELQAPVTEKEIEAVKTSLEWAEQKIGRIVNVTIEDDAIKVADQIAALRLLAQMKGWLAAEKLEHSGPNGGPIPVATDAARARALAAFIAKTKHANPESSSA